ncbi:MAG: aldo/keto reductase [Pseudomonadales bacterium]
MTFGNNDWGCDEPTSQRIVHEFLDSGGNFIDTADAYSAGVSEEITGRAIAGRRSSVVSVNRKPSMSCRKFMTPLAWQRRSKCTKARCTAGALRIPRSTTNHRRNTRGPGCWSCSRRP